MLHRSFKAAPPAVALCEEPVDLIECLYRAARDPLRWPETLALLAAHTNAASATIATYDPAAKLYSLVTSGGDMASTGDHIAAQMLRHRADGRYAGAAHNGLPPVLFIAPKNSGELCHLVLPHPALCVAGRVGWVGVGLSPMQAARREEVSDRLISLRGHLTRALDVAIDLSTARHGTSSAVALLSAMPTAALLLGAAGDIIGTNAAASRLLAERDVVSETVLGNLRAVVAHDDERLARAIELSRASIGADRNGQGRQVVRIGRTRDRSSLLVILDPVPLSNQTSFLAEPQGAVLVRLIGGDQSDNIMMYPLQAAFDLTPAEVRIATAIASGRSPAVAAQLLNLSTNTVRSHLARIFDKTGTRSQHALTRLLAAIGSWPLP